MKRGIYAILIVTSALLHGCHYPNHTGGKDNAEEMKKQINATNGDIVKSLPTITDEWTAYNYAEDCKEVNIKADEILGVSSFKKSWWDAPYGR